MTASSSDPHTPHASSPLPVDHATALRRRLDRIFNDPDRIVEDGLKGVLAAHPEILSATHNPRVLTRARKASRRKVGIVSGGGSGHEPAFLGYVGPGLLDAVAIGEVFSSPSAASFLDAMRAADSGAGVACLFGNYAGDIMNVRLAAQDAARAGVKVATVVATDDVASAPQHDVKRRRGVAGEILMWKVAGACAETGASLDDVVRVAKKAIDSTRSVGVGLSACTIVANGHPNFAIATGMMEVGIGHHGEPGVEIKELSSARDIAKLMIAQIFPDLPFEAGDRVAVLLSGLGATPVIELYVLYADIAELLTERGLIVVYRFVGNYFTSLEMKGVSLTVMRLDAELESLVAASCESIALTQITTEAASEEQPQAPVAHVTPTETRPPNTKAPTFNAVDGIALLATTRIVPSLITAIVDARDWLSEIDGKIGDGDHGINMAKGFTLCAARLGASPPDMSLALNVLSDTLMTDIGGSMGPLYGRFFSGMASEVRGARFINANVFSAMLDSALKGIEELSDAKPGDKTIVDVLDPAVKAFRSACVNGESFARALDLMTESALVGRDSTIGLVAQIGRASRLGERSLGVIDAGAASCCLILQTLAQELKSLIVKKK